MKKVSRAIIVNNEGKILLGKRVAGTAAGLYALIGGKPDEDESAVDAVIREVKEEVGLDFEATPYLEKFDRSVGPDDPWMNYYFVGPAKGKLKLDPAEIESVIYVSRNELDKVNIAFDHKEILAEYFQSLQ
ncbi:MAG: NUDIX hydrolase [Candidatus Yanofskybacteria bacterium]|nr:NUDIX hydrolase [Candidatus Yanofskybacteria bacterium]